MTSINSNVKHADDFDVEIKTILACPSTSYWLRNALSEALSRDCVDASADAEQMADLLKRRAERLLSRTS